MSFQTPKSGFSPVRNFDTPLYIPVEQDLSQPLIQLLGLEDDFFDELAELKQQAAVRTLYSVLEEKAHPMSDLDQQDAFEIFRYILTHELDQVAFSVKGSDLYRTIIAEIPNCLLTSKEKIELGVLLLREGTFNLDKNLFLSSTEIQEVRKQYQLEIDKRFPKANLPHDFEKLKELAHTFFSGARRVPANQHHMVLVGLLYAQDPDLEAITYVMQKYLDEQHQYFYKHGTFVVDQATRKKSINESYSLQRVRQSKSVTVLHPGGESSIQVFLDGNISGAHVDDEKPGLLVYVRASVGDKRMAKSAQAIAARNMDFPAFLELRMSPGQVEYDERTGQSRICSDSMIESYKIKPVQPYIRSPSIDAIEHLYADRPDLVSRIFRSIQHPIQVENPVDPVRRVLFPATDEESKAPKNDVLKTEQTSTTDKDFLQFVFKCLVGLILIKLTLQFFSYLRSKMNAEWFS